MLKFLKETSKRFAASLSRMISLAFGLGLFAFTVLVLVEARNHDATATPIVPYRDVPSAVSIVPKLVPSPPKAPFEVAIRYSFRDLPYLDYWGIRKVQNPRYIRIPEENRLLRFSYEDYVVATYVAFYEAGIFRLKGELGVICVIESLLTRAYHSRHPNTLIGVAFEKRKVKVRDKHGNIIKEVRKYMYSPFDTKSKREGYVDPQEIKRFIEVSHVVAKYFDDLSRGKRNSKCKGVYAFHNNSVSPEFHRKHGDLAVTVSFRDRKGKQWAQMYYRLKKGRGS